MSYAIAATMTVQEASALAAEASDSELIHCLDQAIGWILGHKNSPEIGLMYDVAAVFRAEMNRRRRWW